MVVGTALNSQPHLACQHLSGRHKTSMFFLSFSFSHEIFYSIHVSIKESIDWHLHPIQSSATLSSVFNNIEKLTWISGKKLNSEHQKFYVPSHYTNINIRFWNKSGEVETPSWTRSNNFICHNCDKLTFNKMQPACNRIHTL